MKRISTTLLTLAFIALSGVAFGAPNFVDNSTALPANKTDRIPITNPTTQIGAADVNAIFSALTDIRTVIKRNPDVAFNVMAFGAVGDGVTDDSAAINAAIASAATTRNGVFGGTVFFPKDTYKIGSQITVPNGVALRGDNSANTILRAAPTFNNTSLIKNQAQDGTQEFAFIDSLTIDGNAGNGAIESEAVVSWGSLFVTSHLHDVIITGGSAVGLRVFAAGTPGGMGPILLDKLWVFRNGTDNVRIEDDATNTGAIAGVVVTNLTSENQGNNSSALYLKGRGHFGQSSYRQVHIEQGGTETGRTGITIDGASHSLFDGIQLQAGTPANEVAGITITSSAQNVDIQIRSVTNINLISPVLNDVKNGVTVGALNLPLYMTPDVVFQGLPVSPVNGKSLLIKDSSGTSRAWFDTNGRLTGSGLFTAATEILANPIGTPGSSDDRAWMIMDHTGSNPFGTYYPNGGGGALRERMFTAGADVRQVNTDGSVFNFPLHTFQSNVTLQSSLKGSLAGGTTCPSSGTHTQGEVQLFAAPTAGGFVGCVCTSGGTPGTWKTFGAVSP